MNNPEYLLENFFTIIFTYAERSDPTAADMLEQREPADMLELAWVLYIIFFIFTVFNINFILF